MLTTWTHALSLSPPLPLSLFVCCWQLAQSEFDFRIFFVTFVLFLFCFLLLPCLSGSACLLFISRFMRIRAFLFIPLHSAVLFCCPRCFIKFGNAKILLFNSRVSQNFRHVAVVVVALGNFPILFDPLFNSYRFMGYINNF